MTAKMELIENKSNILNPSLNTQSARVREIVCMYICTYVCTYVCMYAHMYYVCIV